MERLRQGLGLSPDPAVLAQWSALIDVHRALSLSDVEGVLSAWVPELRTAVISSPALARGYFEWLRNLPPWPQAQNFAELAAAAVSDAKQSARLFQLGAYVVETVLGSKQSQLVAELSGRFNRDAGESMRLLQAVSVLISYVLANQGRQEGWIHEKQLVERLRGTKVSRGSGLSKREAQQLAKASGEKAYRARQLLPLGILAALLLLVIAVLQYEGVIRLHAKRAIGPWMTQKPPAIREAVPTFVTQTLPTGVSMRVVNHGAEVRLMALVENLSSRVKLEETPIVLDQVRFEADGITLVPGATKQLAHVREIMRAYPSIQVAVEAPKVQQARLLVDMLVALGVSSKRLVMRGPEKSGKMPTDVPRLRVLRR